MRMLIQPLRKIGRTGIHFKLNEAGDTLEGKYYGKKVRIYDHSPDLVMLEEYNGEEKVFARLGSFQVDRVVNLFGVD